MQTKQGQYIPSLTLAHRPDDLGIKHRVNHPSSPLSNPKVNFKPPRDRSNPLTLSSSPKQLPVPPAREPSQRKNEERRHSPIYNTYTQMLHLPFDLRRSRLEKEAQQIRDLKGWSPREKGTVPERWYQVFENPEFHDAKEGKVEDKIARKTEPKGGGESTQRRTPRNQPPIQPLLTENHATSCCRSQHASPATLPSNLHSPSQPPPPSRALYFLNTAS
jgi:hypothetical protein